MMEVEQCAELIHEFREGLIEHFERNGTKRADAIRIINQNKTLFFAEFQRALDAATAQPKALKPRTLH